MGCEEFSGEVALGIGIAGSGGCGTWPKVGQKYCVGVKGKNGPKGKEG